MSKRVGEAGVDARAPSAGEMPALLMKIIAKRRRKGNSLSDPYGRVADIK